MNNPVPDIVSIPGCPLLTVFMNCLGNYEDSLIISQDIIDMKLFEHVGYLNHPVPMYEKKLVPGSIITCDTSWYRPCDDGLVIREGCSSTAPRYVSLKLYNTGPRVGDKMATQHGQKFIVSEIRQRYQMPIMRCNKTGKSFRPHVIMACSSVHNRGTYSQVVEASIAVDTITSDIEDPRTYSQYIVYDNDAKLYNPTKLNTCSLVRDGKTFKLPGGDSVVIDFGICQFWLLSQLVRDKQQYVDKLPRSIYPKLGRLHGAGVRISELEIHGMLMAGLTKSLEYLTDISDMALVSICSSCRRLTILCDCENYSECTDIHVQVRAPLVKADILLAIESINNSMTPSSLSASSVKTTFKVPQSFVYK
jgi:DNA-directed RNA polymerase beta subunit